MNNLEVLQHWSGYIASIDDENEIFHSVLEDITNGGTDETIELNFSVVDDNQKHLIQDGAIFELKIVREVCENNIGIVKSIIKFQEAKELTEEDYKRAKEWAERMAKKFGWE
jgi:uncharacterized protein (DUF885 family)